MAPRTAIRAARRVGSHLRDDARIVRAERARVGLGGAVADRVRAHLGLAEVSTWVARATWEDRDRVAALERSTAALDHGLASLDERLEALREHTEQAVLTARLDAEERISSCEFYADDTLVTAIIPTRARPRHLERAIASVEAQLHRSWELIVVDTGEDPETQRILAANEDQRVRTVRAPGRTGAAARGLALELATGDLVAYLDDDNVMLPWWLRSVALAARRHPERAAFYGARVHEVDGAPPFVQFVAFAAAVVREMSAVDTNVLAHRCSLKVRWSADNVGAADWELVARLVADGHEPLGIPVRAVVYTVSAPGRVGSFESTPAQIARISELVRTLLPVD